MENNDLKRTCLYQEHILANAKMVEFGGFEMPIEYTSITDEHISVRTNVGLFDVSHMGEILVTGSETTKFLDYVITSDITNAPAYKMTYGLLLYPDGGVVDDLMIYKYSNEKVLIVCNASNTDKDFLWLSQNVSDYEVCLENVSIKYGQLALQGPKAITIMQKLCEKKINDLKLFDFQEIECNEKNMLISRSGYTGEDGFEIYSSLENIISLFKTLVYKMNVPLCGLGCRDTLRFEAGMPLYGHEIDKDINPIEACLNYALAWNKNFIGKEALLKYKEDPKRKLVGIELLDRGIARGGYKLVDINNNQEIGYITTGYLLPKTPNSLVDKPIALGYVLIDYAVVGTVIGVCIRKNVCKAVIRDRKFMQKKYIK